MALEGQRDPLWTRPQAFLELHIEQGPVLDSANKHIGIVEGVQGHRWFRIRLTGCAGHAGTTPMALRRDAAVAAASLILDLSKMGKSGSVSAITVGGIELSPGVINVVPGAATLLVDVRDPDLGRLDTAAETVRDVVKKVATRHGVDHAIELISSADPVYFSDDMCDRVETAAKHRIGADKIWRMISGASHDAQVMSSVCPTAMIFVPSKDGVSHTPAEFTAPAHITLGAQVLCDVLFHMCAAKAGHPQ